MALQTFELISDMTIVYPRDYPAVDKTILDPFAANPLIGGEWLRQKIVNGAPAWERGGPGVETNPLCGPYWGDRGRYEVQAAGTVPCIYLQSFEAYTRVCNTTGLTTSGQKLMITDVTVDGVANKRGLALAAGAAGTLFVAYYEGPGRYTGEIRIYAPDGKAYLT